VTTDNKPVGTKIIKIALIVFGGLIVALVIFWSGMIVGFRKASFSYQWGKNYSNLFMRRPEHKMQMRDFKGKGFMDASSAVGLVIGVSPGTLIIKGDDGVEKSIIISDKTVIRKWQDTIALDNIKIDEKVVVFGIPSSTGQIEARFIRLMPKP
jgi:hypothetical protein